MSAPPWGHKPPPVEKFDRYWTTAPPSPSQRLTYWLRRLSEGSWHANKYLRSEGYYSAAEMAGVYIWEWLHVLRPAISEDYARRFPDKLVITADGRRLNETSPLR